MPVRVSTFFHCLAIAALAMVGATLRADPFISEIMAANRTTLKDEDGAFPDWIELYNPDSTAVNLAGWFLTDVATNKTNWQLPAVNLPAKGFLVIFASGKNRRNPGSQLHTNFSLNSSGEYLGLFKPDGVTVASQFAPIYPALGEDISYGFVPSATGTFTGPTILRRPTPGAANEPPATVPLTQKVTFSQAGGPFRNAFSLTLSGTAAGQQIRYVLISPTGNNAATFPTATSTLYAGPIAISSSVTVRAAVFTTDGSNRGTTREACYSKISDGLLSFSSQLPVLVIDSLGTGPLVKDDIDHASWLYVYPARSNNAPTFGTAPELVSPMTTTVRGASSAEFPKKGFNIEFTDDEGKNRKQALVGFPAQERWALVAPWKYDQSYVNNSFVYSLSNKIGRWAPRTRLAEVYFNATGDDVDSKDYAGIYIVSDRVEIDNDRVDIATLTPSETTGSDLTGGYVLKIDTKEPAEIGWVTSRRMPAATQSSIILVSPNETDVAPAQIDYIKGYVQKMEDALFSDRDSGWSKRTHLDYIDRGAWVDHHILNTFVANPDAFIRSAYFSKDRNAKLVAGPVWDFDRALGSYWDERSFRYDVWAGVGAPDPWRTDWWGVITRDPEFMQDWVDRWQSLRRTELSRGSLISLVDSLWASVGAAAAARDATRWPDNASPYGSYSAQIDHLGGWVTLRAEWIDRQFLASPVTAQSGTSLVFTAPDGAQLAYTLDGSDPRALGGDVAPNAILSSASLTVAATANVHVRSYRASLRGVFPGSPWSAAVGGGSSSPLTPHARLVNISTRAYVGTGENALIAGVVVADTESKRYLARAVGPGLAAFGATGVVPDPQLSILGAGGVELFRNNGWETGPDATKMAGYATSVGAFAFAAGSRDSALANALLPGNYTIQITTPTGRPGVGLVELYELDVNGRTVNLSTRAQVRTGDGVLIGGFVVQGPAYKRMLVRAVGPTLGVFGVNGALADPILTVYSGQTVVATNDRWESDDAAVITTASRSTGAFTLAANSQDAALLITLKPGAYTVEVKGKNNTEGVALLEIYEVP
ncbi:MAG: hypothetical protein EXS37_05495 [Opitutus sp.]|nr:hypothetical protein [Opitutus sp.]